MKIKTWTRVVNGGICVRAAIYMHNVYDEKIVADLSMSVRSDNDLTFRDTASIPDFCCLRILT